MYFFIIIAIIFQTFISYNFRALNKTSQIGHQVPLTREAEDFPKHVALPTYFADFPPKYISW